MTAVELSPREAFIALALFMAAPAVFWALLFRWWIK